MTDPSRESFNTLGFASGVTKLIGLSALSQGLSAMWAGYRPGAIQGNPLQLGGAIIIKPGGTVPYYFASTVAGDHPPIDDLLAFVSATKH